MLSLFVLDVFVFIWFAKPHKSLEDKFIFFEDNDSVEGNSLWTCFRVTFTMQLLGLRIRMFMH